MHVTSQVLDGCRLIQVDGRVHVEDAVALRDTLGESLPSEIRLVVDVSGVEDPDIPLLQVLEAVGREPGVTVAWGDGMPSAFATRLCSGLTAVAS